LTRRRISATFKKAEELMARTKRIIDNELEKEMKSRASVWRSFMNKNKLTQKFLAEITGISRRTIQSVVAGVIIPQKDTLQAFEKLQAKYEAESKPTGKRKSKKTKEEKGEI
jgi:DNA-binding XRE family transcriptional regulator